MHTTKRCCSTTAVRSVAYKQQVQQQQTTSNQHHAHRHALRTPSMRLRRGCSEALKTRGAGWDEGGGGQEGGRA